MQFVFMHACRLASYILHVHTLYWFIFADCMGIVCVCVNGGSAMLNDTVRLVAISISVTNCSRASYVMCVLEVAGFYIHSIKVLSG